MAFFQRALLVQTPKVVVDFVARLGSLRLGIELAYAPGVLELALGAVTRNCYCCEAEVSVDCCREPG